MEEANELLTSKSFYQAIPAFEHLLEIEDNANLNYKLGLCYFNLNKESEAIPYFEKATKDIYKNYSITNISLEFAPVDAYYYLAKCKHVNGNIILAFDLYNTFYKNAKKNNALKDLAYLGILQCEVANHHIDNNTNDIVWNLGDTINTELEESSPLISLDGSTIYFTTSRLRKDKTNELFKDPKTGNYFKDIYESHQTKIGSWTEPKLLNLSKINQNESPSSISPNGNQLLVNNGDLSKNNIYKSIISNSSFNELSPFPAKDLNTNNNEIDASLSINQEFLYFSSDRRGGFGGYDIYRLRKLPDGTWSKAMNLGEKVNSKYDEVSPFIGFDNKTLYFSSNGTSSMGGFDIFISQVNTISVWSEPKNLGIPINSTDDDLHYSTIANGLKGVYSSDRKDKADHDIYFAQSSTSYYQNVAILKGQIKTTDESTLPKGITIIVQDLTDNTKTKVFKPRLKDGGYILNLKPCHNYLIDYTYKEKSFLKIEQLIPCNSSYQEIHKEVILDVVNMNPTIIK
jgi:tetratricopeptide (TPR) repeat protein